MIVRVVELLIAMLIGGAFCAVVWTIIRSRSVDKIQSPPGGDQFETDRKDGQHYQ